MNALKITNNWLTAHKIPPQYISFFNAHSLIPDDGIEILDLLKACVELNSFESVLKLMEVLPIDTDLNLEVENLETDLFCLGDITFNKQVLISNRKIFVKGNIYFKDDSNIVDGFIYANCIHAKNLKSHNSTVYSSVIAESIQLTYHSCIYSSESKDNIVQATNIHIDLNCAIWGDIDDTVNLSIYMGRVVNHLSAIRVKNIKMQDGLIESDVLAVNLTMNNSAIYCNSVTADNISIYQYSSIDIPLENDPHLKYLFTKCKVNTKSILIENSRINGNVKASDKIIFKSGEIGYNLYTKTLLAGIETKVGECVYADSIIIYPNENLLDEVKAC